MSEIRSRRSRDSLARSVAFRDQRQCRTLFEPALSGIRVRGLKVLASSTMNQLSTPGQNLTIPPGENLTDRRGDEPQFVEAS